MFADFYILLLAAHHLADYPFQTDHQTGHKADAGWAGWRANLSHAAVHVAAGAVLLGVGAVVDDLRINLVAAAFALLWVGGTHAFIDRRWPIAHWMMWARQTGWAQHGGAAFVDQTAHLVVGLLPAALLLGTLRG